MISSTLGLGYLSGVAEIAWNQEVDLLTERLECDGHRIVDGPRRTGDSCYESVVLDPDGNRIEITA